MVNAQSRLVVVGCGTAKLITVQETEISIKTKLVQILMLNICLIRKKVRYQKVKNK